MASHKRRYQRGGGVEGGEARGRLTRWQTKHKILSMTLDTGHPSLCGLTMVKPHQYNCV